MQTPLVAGRDFDDADMAQHRRVVVINQEFARRFLAAASPLGQRVTVSSSGPDDLSLEIVGIVRDARISGTSAGSRPEMYIPFPVAPARGFYLVVQTVWRSPAHRRPRPDSSSTRVHRTP